MAETTSGRRKRPVKAPEKPLRFEDTTFKVVQINDEPWMRSIDVFKALGYRDGCPGHLFLRYRAQFTPEMVQWLTLPTPGGPQRTRVFSFRGAHLLSMLSRTEAAPAFRLWLLDVLDKAHSKTVPRHPARHQ